MNRKERRSAESQNKQSPNELWEKAVALHQAGHLNEAEALYRSILASNPRNHDALAMLGTICLQRGNHQEGFPLLTQAIALNPLNARAYENRGLGLAKLEKYAEAFADYDKAAALNPNSDTIYNNRGVALYSLGRYGEALKNYDRAIAINPRNASAYNNRGLTFYKLGQSDASLSDYNKAILLNPNYVDAYGNRGLILNDLGQYDAALADYDRALAVNPDYADAQWYKGLLKLLLGDYQEGWKLYEWRWKAASMAKAARVTTIPLWLGKESLAGKTILLHEEQGQGDTLQFCRYVPMVAALGAKVFLMVSPSLAGVLSTLKGNPVIIPNGSRVPHCDFHCSLMSLPLAFGTKVETIPSEPYLSAQPEYVEKWRPILDDKLGKQALRVGLCWAGGIRPENPDAMRIDAMRSLQFSQVKPLLDCKNIAFVSLQLGPPKDQLDDSRVLDISSELKDWSDTAAVISMLDLVITVDTSVCHLAGALGKKFWLLNRHETCWRWLLEREDSPWYPTARLFRQQRPKEWDSVIMRVKEELTRNYPNSNKTS